MAEYQLTATDIVLRTADQTWIPNDPRNRDRIEYDEWVVAGGVPDPYVAPPPPPPVVNANARLDAGVLASLTNAVAAVAAIHAISSTFTAQNFAQLLTQMKIVGDSFVAMLQAHAATSSVDVGSGGKPPTIGKPPSGIGSSQ